MNNTHMSGAPQLFFLVLFSMLLGSYIGAVITTNKRYKKWPMYRTICWMVGLALALLAVAGPLANLAHTDFRMHMIGHLLLGMVAPLFLVVAMPVQLLLRTVPISAARLISSILRSWPARIITHPMFTMLVSSIGLWVLYTTELFSTMHMNPVLYVVIHIHLLMIGYLFTFSIVYFGLVYHRVSYEIRASMLILALAIHGILAKYLYANPPVGVKAEHAEIGSLIMFYGGDVVDAILIFLLCYQWYKSTKPRQEVLVRKII